MLTQLQNQRIHAVEIAWRAADTATAARQAECAVRGFAMTRRPNVPQYELRGFVPSNTMAITAAADGCP
jgi:hypothetical protein